MTTTEIRRMQQDKHDEIFDRVCKERRLTPAALAVLKPEDLAAAVKSVVGKGVAVPPVETSNAAKAYARRRGSMV